MLITLHEDQINKKTILVLFLNSKTYILALSSPEDTN